MKTSREELGNCMRMLREGDTLVVYRLDRLGRSLRELVTIMEHHEKHDIGFHSLTESIDTTSAGGRFIFNIFGAVAQFERELISERTKAGLKAARARGRKGGRKPKLTEKQAKDAIKLLEANPEMIHEQVARLHGVSRVTLYRAWDRHGLGRPTYPGQAIHPKALPKPDGT